MRKVFLLLSIILGGITMVSCGEDTAPITPTKPEYATLINDVKDVNIEVEETYTFEYIIKKNQGVITLSTKYSGSLLSIVFLGFIVFKQ